MSLKSWYENNVSKMLVLLTVALVFFNVFDGLSTMYALMALGARELNPLMRALFEYSPWAFLVVKLGYAGVVAVIVLEYRKTCPNSLFGVMVGVTGAYSVLFIYQVYSLWSVFFR